MCSATSSETRTWVGPPGETATTAGTSESSGGGKFGPPQAAKPGQRVRAYGTDGDLVAVLLFEPEKSGWRPEKVLASL